MELECQDESFCEGCVRLLKDSFDILRVKNFRLLLVAVSFLMAIDITSITILSQILRPSLLKKYSYDLTYKLYREVVGDVNAYESFLYF